MSTSKRLHYRAFSKKEVQSLVWVGIKEASGGRDKGEVRFGDQSEHKIVEDGHVVSSGMFFETGLVFVQRDIARVMQIVLDVSIGT